MNAADSAPGNKLVRLARWILVLPTAYVGWSIALLVGVAILGAIDRLCPLDLQVSSHCVAPWYPVASQAVFAVGAGLAAALIVVMCTLMAPANRRTVSRAVFVVGSLVALILAVMGDAWVEASTAILVGALVAYIGWNRRTTPP